MRPRDSVIRIYYIIFTGKSKAYAQKKLDRGIILIYNKCGIAAEEPLPDFIPERKNEL